MTSPLD